mgnify:CR=1 FL=1
MWFKLALDRTIVAASLSADALWKEESVIFSEAGECINGLVKVTTRNMKKDTTIVLSEHSFDDSAGRGVVNLPFGLRLDFEVASPCVWAAALRLC